MKPLRKYILYLLLLNLCLIAAGYIFSSLTGIISFNDTFFLLSGYTIISLIVIVIFLRGQVKDPESQTFHTLAAIGLKLLLEMIFALIWFVLVKKNSMEYVIVFFVLYLAFTLFSLIYILKLLKNKLLKT